MNLVRRQLSGAKGSVAPVERRQNGCRRSISVASFVRGNIRPRRRHNRRHEDDVVLLDWHEPRILYLALAILLLSCTDALFTLNLMAVGAEEMNVLMKALMEKSVGLFLASKISLTAISVVVLVGLAQRSFMGWFRVVRVMQLVCAGYFGLIAYQVYLLSLAMAWI